MKQLIAFSFITVLLTACGAHKRMDVMSKGPAIINTDAGTITAKDGAGHEEKMADISGKNSFTIHSPAGDATVQFAEDGLYVVNAKTDTIIGTYERYTDPMFTQNVVTQDALRHKIDSLQQLMEGKNVTAENRNFFILPNHAVRISDHIDATIVGPYHRMTSVEKVDGKEPEVYRFYSIREVRETLAKMISLTIPEKK